MKQNNSEYTFAAFGFSLLSIIGSVLSIINIIPLITTYELISNMNKYDNNERIMKMISSLFQLALFLTLASTVFYIAFQH